MNFFKKIVEELKARIAWDVGATENGLCLNVRLKDGEVCNKDKSFFLDVIGYKNPVGGILITVLESESGDFLAPKFKDDSGMFIFLNGFLVPDWHKDRTLVHDLVNVYAPHDVKRFGLLLRPSNEVSFANGYTLRWYYLDRTRLAQFVDDKGFDLNLFSDVVADVILTDLVPEDPTIKFVNTDDGREGPFDDICANDIAHSVAQTVVLNGYDKENYDLLPKYISRYLYSYILRDIEKDASSLLNKTVVDIPMGKADQTSFLKHLQSTVSDENWKQFKDKYILEY